MADGNRMIFLGFGKYARADKIYAIEPIRDDRRGHGRRTLVWVEGVSDPIVASLYPSSSPISIRCCDDGLNSP